MATWNSLRSVNWFMDTGFDYAECENTWSYGTVADVLTIKTNTGEYSTYGGTRPPSEQNLSYSKFEALALLETLIDWAETYEGDGTVGDMLNKRIAKIAREE